jgi:hypothetical protein
MLVPERKSSDEATLYVPNYMTVTSINCLCDLAHEPDTPTSIHQIDLALHL